MNPITNKIYVANYNDDNVSVIDGLTDLLVATVAVGDGPYGVGINPDANKIYISNRLSNSLSVIDGETDSVVATVTVGTYPEDVGVNPNTNKIYVANIYSDNVSVIDGSINSVIATIPVSNQPQGIGVNSATNKIYISSWGRKVSVIDGAVDAVIQIVHVGNGPQFIGVNDSTNRIYVSCYMDGAVWVLEDKTGIEENPRFKIADYGLEVYPNPLSQKTEIRFQIPDARYQSSDIRHLTSNISLRIYDLTGRLVKSFPITDNQSLITSIYWDRKDNNGRKIGNGVYFCRLEAGGKTLTEKVCVIK